MDWQQIIDFWFVEIEPAAHWRKDPAFDQLIADRFGELVQSAAACELFTWREQPQGRLAEIIVLDQFSRNIYRDQPQSFANDALALALAQQSVDLGVAEQLSVLQRTFLYMPYMHSESKLVHQQAVALFDQPGLEENHRFELKHQQIIDRFGRYPHRNVILGRASTEEELVFLQQPGSSF
ncbi:MAG: DUF924 family protein [Motiliproteus sp.]